MYPATLTVFSIINTVTKSSSYVYSPRVVRQSLSRRQALSALFQSKQVNSADSAQDCVQSHAMPRGIKKENLPKKICVTCGRPFTWRKKWERVWDEVTTCSKSCNKKRKEEKQKDVQRNDLEITCAGSHPTDPHELATNLMPQTDTTLDAVSVIENQVSSMITLERVQSDQEICENYESLSFSDSRSEYSQEFEQKLSIQAERKAAKKAKKAERRAQRQGHGDPMAGKKACDMCSKYVNLLVRCTYDKTGEWKMVCGKCWNEASGGVVDGDAAHPYYKYGGLWKNRRAQGV